MTLSRQLVAEYARGFEEKNLWCILREVVQQLVNEAMPQARMRMGQVARKKTNK